MFSPQTEANTAEEAQREAPSPEACLEKAGEGLKRQTSPCEPTGG